MTSLTGSIAAPFAMPAASIAIGYGSKNRVARGGRPVARWPMPFMKPPTLGFLVTVSLAVLSARADGGYVGHVFASAGKVIIHRGCESLHVRQSARLHLSDLVRTGSASRASIRIAGFGHFDVEPETSIGIDLFYRSPNEAALKSLLEISVHAGGFRFLSESRETRETRLGFSESVISTRYANLIVKEQNGGPGVILLRGEISVETNAGIIRRIAPAWIGDVSRYRSERIACAVTS